MLDLVRFIRLFRLFLFPTLVPINLRHIQIKLIESLRIALKVPFIFLCSFRSLTGSVFTLIQTSRLLHLAHAIWPTSFGPRHFAH